MRPARRSASGAVLDGRGPRESWRGATLRERRLALGLTTTSCATACDARESTWLRWESGSPPPATRLRAIVRVLGCTFDDLFVAEVRR